MNAPAADAVIAVDGLSKAFDGRPAVEGLSLRVQRGEIFGFLGPNGSGKTTSIRMLCGLLTPDAGEGRCLGYDLRRESGRIKREVGYMTQRFSFYEDLSIRENLEFVAAVYAVADAGGAVRQTLASLGLEAREKELAGALSGGWKQRLALGACLLHRPKLLLLDEPTAGVDPGARRDFWGQIHALAADGITVLVSTHYMDEAERCHRLAYMSAGRLLAEGTPAELVANAGLSTWTVSGDGLAELQSQLLQLPQAEQVVPFGNLLQVSGADGAALEAALQPYFADARWQWQRGEPRLEDVFIHLMRGAERNA